ncbi:hypothetical protein, partial [Pseudomonas sp. FW306-2-11AD]|uniref:hypothetical protein n=1 Tax=Pseudomonas sp. FW306-2-11AD TaxID=2070665 RepID=UPI001C484FAF
DQTEHGLANDKSKVQPNADRKRAVMPCHRRMAMRVPMPVAVRMPVMIVVPVGMAMPRHIGLQCPGAGLAFQFREILARRT